MDESAIRELFAGTRDRVYLDAAACSLLPRPVVVAVTSTLERQAVEGALSVPRDLEAVDATRSSVARLIGAEARHVAFAANTAEAIARVADGLDFGDGDEVVLGDLEYPANVYPWVAQRWRGVRIRIVRSEDGRLEASRLVGALGPRTRVLAVSQVQFSSGYRMDLETLGRACAVRGVLLCVDAIQGLGVLPLDVRSLGIGALAADGRKWLMGPCGAAFLYVAPEWVPRIAPRPAGAMSVRNGLDFMQYLGRLDADGQPDLPSMYRDGAGRYEAGYYNAPGLAGLGAALEVAESIGRDAIRRRVTSLAEHLARRLEEAGFPVHGPRSAEERAGIVTFSVPGSAAETLRGLESEGFVLSLRDGRLRASPHVYNTVDEAEALVARVRALARG